MREDGLTCSENMLETDTKAFLKFFNTIKQETQEASTELDDQRRNKNEKTGELRSISEQIQILVSQISKNIESLTVYNDFKKFLDSLPSGSKDEKEEFERMQSIKKERQEKRKKQAELAVRNQPQVQKNNFMGGQPKSGAGSRSKEGKQGGAVPNLDTELNIPAELQPIIDDSDDDFPLKFNDHTELIDIFSALEENNLLEIIRMQESEQELESKKQQMKLKEAEFAMKL